MRTLHVRSINILRWLMVMTAILAVPVIGYAQDATVNGTVTDTTGGVLPGVTVTAQHDATGNTFLAVTDEGGVYRIAVRVGTYKFTTELVGFAPQTRAFEVLLGQTLTVNLQLSAAGVQESVTVTGEAPLIQATQSTLAGNVDPRQMETLPTNGGNWQDLAILAPGNRANAIGTTPTARNRYDHQINMDGQQLTNNGPGSGTNPRFSIEAIGEFQFVASRWDASQGRSNGVIVNAVTKSGTNAFAGSFGGRFRDDKFNADDLILGRPVAYSNRAWTGTVGGPILQDRAHFFGFYENEVTPRLAVFTTPFPRFNAIEQEAKLTDWNGGVRFDLQTGPQTHWMLRGAMWTFFDPTVGYPLGSPINAPHGQTQQRQHADQIYLTFSKVLSNRALNEIKAGYAGVLLQGRSVVHWPQAPSYPTFEYGTPRINFDGFGLGQANNNFPQLLLQEVYSIRDDFTYSFTARGRHDLKVGGEFFKLPITRQNCRPCMGIYDAANARPPANLEDLFPVWNDVSTWNLNALNPIIRSYQLGIGDYRGKLNRRKTMAGWVQDNWQILPALTLNLGLRYDLETETVGNDLAVPPILQAGRPDDRNNVGPRAGFAWSVNTRTVIRGGVGKYYGQLIDNISSAVISASKIFAVQIPNDLRPDFATNPFNGPMPSYEQLVRSNSLQSVSMGIADPNMVTPYSWMSTIGFQRQIGTTMAVTADFNFNGARRERISNPNVNLTYNPATGLNYSSAETSRRPIPGWGTVIMETMNGLSNYRGLETAFTKRMSNKYQVSGTYNFAFLHDDTPLPYVPTCTSNLPATAQVWELRANSVCTFKLLDFPVAEDLGGEYGLATSDQRHRAVFNGIWDAGYGFNVSGLYFFGSGARFATSAGGDRRNLGVTGQSRLRANGSIVPRNDFVGSPLHRVDVRVSRTFAFGPRVRIEGIVDLFNVFNRANYGGYTTVESSPAYGQPTQLENVAYQSRRAQLGFRATF